MERAEVTKVIVTENKRPFYCELCDKQYRNHAARARARVCADKHTSLAAWQSSSCRNPRLMHLAVRSRRLALCPGSWARAWARQADASAVCDCCLRLLWRLSDLARSPEHLALRPESDGLFRLSLPSLRCF